MNLTCPKCHGDMRAYERNGVTVDQCTECRGIFLDRGELERLSNAEISWHGESPDRGRRDDYRGHDDYRGGYQKKKKKSFLDELFD